MIGLGYEGLSVDELIGRLRDAQVDILVDVRLNALSRKAGFSKRALSTAVEAAGIRYIHDPRLGNPKENRAAFADASSTDGLEARRRFADSLTGGDGADGVRDLVSLVEHHSVALLCFEADGRHCHREQVIAAVETCRSPVGV